MKNAKKLMLLLLSLVLLVGAFAVAAFAEDAADAATVVYPDGTVETYAVGETIVPKAFTDGFYEGKGNTLWQDDADAGWTFTVAGEAAALSDLKITQDMVGKTISASGVKQVYSVIDIHLPEGDYYEYITGSSYKIKVDGEEVEKKNAIYVLSGTSGTATHMVLENGVEVEKTVEYNTTKRVAGDYKLYFYDAASFVKFFSTSCSIELGGVVVDNKDLRTLKDTKITATLYADQTIGNTFYWGNGHDRATNKNMSNSIAQGEGGNAQVYFDLNGHTVVNNATGTMTLTEMTLVMYSSKPGAHFFKEASPTAFYVSDGCSFYVGNISTDNSTYSNNLSVHAKALFSTMYGSGAYITGGHYYQTEGATSALFDFARRLNAIQNASFYAQNGNAILDDDPSDGGSFANGSKAITNCSFYSFGTSPLANLAKGATPKFENCSFYNVTGVPADATAGSAAPKTVTFADGTTMQYFAETLEEAKAFVESLSQVKSPAPYGKWIDGEYMLSLNPIAEVTYDASFNATVAITDTAFAKVYYTTEEKQVNGITTMVYHTTDDFASYFTSANVGDQGDGAHTGALSYSAMCAKGAMTQIAITIYENVKCDAFTFTFLNNYTIKTLLDLNGYTLDLGNTSNQMDGMELWIYSSRPGAHFYSSANVAFTVDDVFTLNLGAADANGTYARNINFHCKGLFGNLWGSGANIYGGNYYQLPGSSATGFVSIARRVTKINNANFFVLPGYSVFYDGAYDASFYGATTGANPITGCSFYALGENVSLMNSVAGATPKFASCSFYGVSAENVGSKGSVDVTAATNTFDSALPTMRTLTWADGTTEKFFATSLEEAKAYVESLPKIKESAPYAVTKDGVLYMALTPTLSVEYDDNFNATVVGNDGPLTLVYYTVEETLTGKINYVTEPNLGAYLAWATHGGANVTLYQDMSIGNVTVLSERVPVDSTTKSQAENAVYKLDLNGHKLAFTGSGLALDVKVANLYIYSSVAGGTIDAKGHTLFRSNNDDYKWKDGKAYINDGSDDWGAYTGTTNIKPTNYTILGEADKSGNKVYADNLTVYCEKINENMYGNGAYIYGGTFIQDEGVNPGYFLMMGRSGGTTSHVQEVKNATFVLNSTCTAVFNLGCTADRTFTNVTIISNNKSGAALTSFTALKYVSTFVDCNFVNVAPLVNAKVVYDGGNINMSGIFTSEDLNAGEGEAYLVHAAEPKTVTANGETYVLNGTIVSDLSKVLKLTRENAGLEYWEIGAVVPTEAADVTKVVGNTIYMDAYYDYSGVAEKIDADGKVIAAGEASVAVAFNTKLDVAFTYQVAGGEVQYVETLGDPEKDGEKFVELLNNLSNVKIVMYSDIILHSGVLFGTYKDPTAAKPILGTSGNVDWDLNGCTVTVAADATPVKMVMENDTGSPLVNVIHYIGNYSFKLYSSVPGGEYINKSQYEIFGISKYSSRAPSYLLGTNDPAVDGGDNFTLISASPIVRGYESSYTGPLGALLYINGGTYVYTGSTFAFHTAGTSKIYNAKIITTGAAKTVFLNHYWCTVNFLLADSEVIATNAATYLVETGNNALGAADKGKKQVVKISNVSFAGGTLLSGYKNGVYSFTFEGDIKAPNAEGLNAAYPTAPDGKIPAYSSITVYGQTAKVLGYCDASAVVTVKNATTGLTEDWFAGATYYAGVSSSMYQIDGVWYYYTAPVWEATVDGEAVEDILVAENAGKTVVVNIGGEKELLYFTHDVGGVVTAYYGDATAANSALVKIFSNFGTTNSALKLYSDFTLKSGSAITVVLGGKSHTADLNGYKLTLDVPGNTQALKFNNGKLFIYSSLPGGVLDASAAASFWMTDGAGEGFLGEPNATSTEYGKNFTLICKAMNTSRLWSTNGYIYGGTYIQSENAEKAYFLAQGNSNGKILVRNATFILNNVTTAWMNGASVHGNAMENVTVIAKNPTAIFASMSGYNAATTFKNCYFYNITFPEIAGASYTFENCYFDSSAEGVLGAGFVAKTDKPIVKTVNGVDYTFGALYTASATLVDWGFGLDAEYWVIGAVAERDAAVVDGMFVYVFKPVEVGADPVTAEAILVQTVGEKFLVELEITNQIIFRLYVAADCGLKTIEIDGATINFADAAVNDEGYYVLEKAYAPNHAADDISIVVTGAYKHEFIINLELYAASIMEYEEFAYYKNLTYALIEYVELMSGKDIAIDAPEGYEAYVASPEKAENAEGVLSLFSICHDDMITFAVMGKAGTNVVLTFNESDTIFEGVIDESGAVTFVFDDVKLLSETFTFEAGEEIYTYSLENYIYALENADAVDADVIEKLYALYNYAEHAVTYMAE